LVSLEHEIGWESVEIPLGLLNQTLGLDAVEIRKIFIEHHLASAKDQNSLFDGRTRSRLK
jgi:hypothetical protein